MAKSILLIDDDHLVRESLRKLLEVRGFSVTSVSSGEEAIQWVERPVNFDLIISDIRMPGQNGIEVVERIQEIQKDQGRQSSFLFITGYADDDAPQHATRLGVTEFVLKPFNLDDFFLAVERQLNLHEKDDHKKIQTVETEKIRPGSTIGKWKYPGKNFTFEKPILLKETNIMGNTYYDNYLTWQGEARERLLLSHPAIADWLQDNRHLKMITHSIYHRFLTETTFGDLVRVEAITREIKQCSFIMVFRFLNAKTSAVLGEGWQRICFHDLNTRKLCHVPQLILDLIEPIKEDETKKVLENTL